MTYIQLIKNEGVASITLLRSEKYNSFVRQMALELQSSLDDAATDEQIRCILITGSGKAFSAGQDLAEATDPDGPNLQKILTEHYNPIITRIRNIPKPIIAAVNGVAAGAGANIALACDIVLVAESASFIQAFSKIGLIPDSGGTFHLPRLIGFQRASALMMTGDKVSAKDAFDMGMVYKTFPDDVFMTECNALAVRMSTMPTYGLALTKSALNQSLGNTLIQQLKVEDSLQTLAGNSADYKEGTTAFLEKRMPKFTGK